MGKGVQKEDIHLRINFLYQAAHVTLAQNPNNIELVRFYCHTLKSIAKKNVLRLDPSLKRNLCKKCCMLLIPGITSTVRHRTKRQPHTVVTCLECGVVKRFNTGTEYQLWSERREAWQGQVPKTYTQPQVMGMPETSGAANNNCTGSQQTIGTKNHQDKTLTGEGVPGQGTYAKHSDQSTIEIRKGVHDSQSKGDIDSTLGNHVIHKANTETNCSKNPSVINHTEDDPSKLTAYNNDVKKGDPGILEGSRKRKATLNCGNLSTLEKSRKTLSTSVYVAKVVDNT